MFTGEYTAEELELIRVNELQVGEVTTQWALFPDQNLDTVIGSVKMLKAGQGQERNEGFVGEEAPAPAAE